MTAPNSRLPTNARDDASEPRPLPYGRQLIEDDDVAAVVAALRSDHLAQGPGVTAFETEFAEAVGAREAVACSSGTAALHLALSSLGVGQGDVCIVPAITFLSTATAARFCGAEVLFADVDSETGLMTPATLKQALEKAPKRPAAVLPVHLAGRLCDTSTIAEMAREVGASVIEDACHAVGGRDAQGSPVGACVHSQAAVFSFHPVKTLAAGEGGMVTLNSSPRAERTRRLRNHGVTRDPALLIDPASFDASGQPNPWSYEQLELGFNYRMNELEAALGRSQLTKLDRFTARRRALATLYDAALAPLGHLLRPTARPQSAQLGLHLYTILLRSPEAVLDRAGLVRRLSAAGVATQVHYIPLYRQSYFKARYGGQTLEGAEAYYGRVLALPLFPAMRDTDVDRVVSALGDALDQCGPPSTGPRFASRERAWA